MSSAIMSPAAYKARPLNSWMAYRSFYHGIFVGAQQKHASTYLNILWQQDPFKAKWAVVAKTYTLIRDKVGKNMAPLDVFLDLTCPKIGIIAKDSYLEVLGWTMTYGDEGMQLTLANQSEMKVFGPALTSCSMTEIDLLQYVIDSTYLDKVETLVGEVHHSSTHILASGTPMPLTKARNRIRNRVATTAVGSSTTAPLVRSYRASLQTGRPAVKIPRAVPTIVKPKPVLPPYEWAGSMSELYKPAEMVLDFEAMVAQDEWTVTDIDDPVMLDSYLQVFGGHSLSDLNAGQNGEPDTVAYHFHDSF